MASDSEHSPQFKEVNHILIQPIPLSLLTQHRARPVNDASICLSSQYLRLLTTEAIHRAAEVAEKERALLSPEERRGPALLEVSHLEKVLSGLLLDL
ncbi:BZ3500_MvSof-1268-A1-R1_Chr11-1g03158 [Microbotryum saponariae]|uniref:BZ3500_MvSof-1268-A1-R1_Chr11-1g03158 protein n=1 Tax=Microbotryum saponariae TaxID=289078 RepID=A0A2X0LAV3_9BASI|nr:BZ3501_MvSof-1269-A2-R1_Chr11g02733 [Microbotryum saponariae]SDA03718.1 BZ3500_MvSof-1268-A1-R1_Chr11-1g03158 [Microbotryum saponariae]